MKFIFPIIAYTFMGIFEVVSDVLSKKWAIGEGGHFLIIAMGLYTTSALLFAVSLKFQELSTAIIIFTAINMFVTVIAGHYLFNEEISTLTIAVLGLMIIAFGLQLYESTTA